MGRDNKLSVALIFPLAQELKKSELTGGRESSFRFVEQVDAGLSETIKEYGKERLAVRPVVKRFTAAGTNFIEIRRQCEKRLGPEEKSSAHLREPREAKRGAKRRLLCHGGKVVVSAAAFNVKTCFYRDRFK